MRLLHTSDWHLGQYLHNFDRHYEHQCFLDWLLDTLVSENADVLLVAGDVFDNTNPSAPALRQFYRFLQQVRSRAPGVTVIVTAGNHDSPARLEAPAPLLDIHGVTVIGSVPRTAEGEPDLESMLLPLHDRHGAHKGWCMAVPFLRPADVPRLMPPEGVENFDAYLAGIGELYRRMHALALERRQPGQAIVAMGHCHMVDSQASLDSERRIVIGGSDALPASLFGDGICYAALGHLHLAQRIGQKEHLRYCGSPIPLSFSETNYQHQVLRIDIDGEALQSVTPLHVPRAVPLLRIPAKPAPLDEVLATLAALEIEDAGPNAPFLEVRVLLDGPEPGLRQRIETALAGKPVRLARIEPTRAVTPAEPMAAALSLEQLAALQPDDIFKRLYQQRHGCDAPEEQLSAFAELLRAGDGE
jgi:DNA repair protein SbcD/Mre11